MNCPEGLHVANIHTGLFRRWWDQQKSTTGQKSPLSCSYIWIEVKQLSQSSVGSKESSETSLAAQLPAALAHQGSKHNLGVTEWKQSHTKLFFALLSDFKNVVGGKQWGKGGREKPDLVFLISRGRREVWDLCYSVSSLPQRKVNPTWQKLNVNVSNYVQKHMKLKGQLMVPFESKT